MLGLGLGLAAPPLERAAQLSCVVVQPRALRRGRGIRVRVRVQVVASVVG